MHYLNPDPIREDFRNFLYITWKHLGLPDPTPVQYDLAHYLQHGPRRKMVMAFRGVGKSWIYAAFVCWRLYCDPDYKIMVVSASKAMADSFSTFVKRLIAEIPILQHLQAKADQRDSNIMFDVGPAKASKDPSVKSVGITGQITGSRADEILADDIESLNNSATQTSRERLSELIKEFDAVLKPGGVITYLGTPQTEMSIYNALPERGYEIRVWTARVPVDPDKYRGRLSPFIIDMIAKGASAGSPVDPRRFDDADLKEREASYGRAGFTLQFMLDTSLSDLDKYPLKVSDLIVWPLDRRLAPANWAWASGDQNVIGDIPNVAFQGDRYHAPMWHAEEMGEFTGGIMYVDPSGRGKDETAYAVVKILNGFLFLTAAGGMRGGYDPETLQRLATVAKAEAVNLVQVEQNFGDGMFTALLKPVLSRVYPVTVEEILSKGQKEARIIDTLEPVMSQHRLIVDKSLIRRDFEDTQADPKYGLFYQLTRLTRDRGALAHDDRVEALAGAVNYWQQHMARDTQKAAQSHREALLEAELKQFVGGVLGAKNSAQKWATRRL